jgi:hypothetical protein
LSLTGVKIKHANCSSRLEWLRWRPHALSVNQNRKVLNSKLLRTALREHKRTDFVRAITSEESSFFPWLGLGGVAQRPSSPNQVQYWHRKMLDLIPWLVSGIQSILDVPKATMYNATFFTDVFAPSLISNTMSRSHMKTLKGWAIHMGRAHPHNPRSSRERMRVSKAEQLRHPAEGPLPLWTYRRKIPGYNCLSLPHFLKTIAEIFSQINKAMPICIFEAWTKRLQ